MISNTGKTWPSFNLYFYTFLNLGYADPFIGFGRISLASHGIGLRNSKADAFHNVGEQWGAHHVGSEDMLVEQKSILWMLC